MQAYIEEFKEKKYKAYWLISKTYETPCTKEELLEVAKALNYREGWAHFQEKNIKAYKHIEAKAKKEKLSLEVIEKLLSSSGVNPDYASKIYLGNY